MAKRDVEDIYPLSPMQEGMLFHTLYTPTASEYVNQTCFTVGDDVDVEALERAWAMVVSRHPALRSSAEWRNLERPLQLVHRRVSLPIERRPRAPGDPLDDEAWVDRFLAEDRRRGLELDAAPLMRLTLIDGLSGSRRLIWTHHHLLLDGWSTPMVLAQVRRCYRALIAGEELSLPEPPPFRDFIAWLSRRDAAADEAWWRRELEGFVEPTFLFGSPARTVLSAIGTPAAEVVRLGAASTARLLGMARDNRLTLNTVLQGMWALVLSRYSASDDVAFGITVSGRPAELAGVEDMIGLFINTIPMRVHVPATAAAVPWLQGLQQHQAAMRGHEHAPLADVQRWTSLPPGTPLFETLLVFENYPNRGDDRGDEGDVVRQGSVGQTNFPLTLAVLPGEQLEIRMHFDSGRFSRDAVSRLGAHLRRLLEDLPQRPGASLRELGPLDANEREHQLVDWNQTASDLGGSACLHELIAAQSRRTPNAVVADEHTQLTFAEVDALASRLAARLQQLGVGPNQLVGVCMQRSTGVLVTLLAILKAGGGFVPLEPDQPRQRLAEMIREAQPIVIVTTAQDRQALPSTRARVVAFDADRDSWLTQAPLEAPPSPPDQLAYVLYTSGSSGVPKGVVVEQRALVNQLLWMAHSFGLSTADRVLHKTPLGFDPALWELFCPLLSGAALVMMAPGEHADPQCLVAAVRDHGITVMSFVPSMLEEFVAAAEPADVASLRLVTSGGEPTTPALVRSFFSRFDPSVELRNMYGPTEAVITATWWRCQPPGDDQPVPIGRPVANTQVYVLDEWCAPVPIGAPGELCIGGAQVALGYLRQPKLSAERFVPSPFRPGERLYRTGDFGRFREDGAIEFLGRRDAQVKIRGIRIELGEIEAAMLGHPEVRQGVTALRADADGQPRLVAYVVPARRNQPPTLADLRTSLAERLPLSMLPSALVLVDQLPTAHSGKVDRSSLPNPTWKPILSFRAPRSVLEQRLAAIWERMLRVQRVGIDDDFFELGGHSLLAVRLLAKIERDLGVVLPLATFFDGSVTVARLAAAIGDTGPSELAAPADGGEPSGATAPVFFVQPGESAMLTLRHFTRAFGSRQRVVGLLPERDGARFDQSKSIENLAAGILAAMREIQPAGPYYVTGFSMGGLLAYEIASQLRVAGEEVAWLGLLDAAPPGFSTEVMRRRLRLQQRFARQRERGLTGALRHTGFVIDREVTAALVRLRLRRSRLGDDFDWRGALRLASRYACPGNDVAADLFVAAEGVAESGSPSLGWDEVHKGVLRIHDVPGGHVSMMTEPHVGVVAEMLAASLRRAQAEQRVPV